MRKECFKKYYKSKTSSKNLRPLSYQASLLLLLEGCPSWWKIMLTLNQQTA